ncbi:glycosyltransferase family 4 protein [Candidatus Saccharibacteria bacterium]|nr:glycosyltransferase family 4 protein [Candidatus Saccharibacteria bacterium]
MKKQKKVLFVATVASHIRRFHTPYLKLFKEKEYKTYVASGWNLSDDEKIDYCDNYTEISVQRSPYSFKNLKAIRELKDLIDAEKFDMIHCHTPMGAVVARLAAKKARKKYGTRVIYTAHGFHFYNGAPKKNWVLFYPVEWYLAKYTDTLITINQEDYKRAREKFEKRCKDIRYVPGVGIDVEKFNVKITKAQKKELRSSLGLKEDDFVLIFPARLDRNKNQRFLIDVMGELVSKDSDIHLVLPGPDELNGYYQKLTEEKGLQKNIHFLDIRNDIPELMAISNVAVSSSLREGLPVNIMEAFAAGKPVVALSCRGVDDLVENGKKGYVISSVSEMVDRILLLKNNRKISREIMANNKEKAKKYSIDSTVDKMNDVYFGA